MTAIDTDVAAVQRMFDVNLFGPMRMVHHFHDLLINAKGTIVNIGSIGGIIPYLYGCESTTCIRSLCLNENLRVSESRTLIEGEVQHHTMPPRQPFTIGATHYVLSWRHWSEFHLSMRMDPYMVNITRY